MSHEFKATLAEDVFYPDHAPRVETPTFAKTKRDGHARGDVCAISGQAQGVEYHHLFCEDAFTDAVDWPLVKAIALGTVTALPVLDLVTGQPTGNTFPVAQSFIGWVVDVTRARGFDWAAFDPTMPETFVDSPQNMLVLHERFHRAVGHSIHHLSFPVFCIQGWPLVPDFVFSPDELTARHNGL